LIYKNLKAHKARLAVSGPHAAPPPPIETLLEHFCDSLTGSTATINKKLVLVGTVFTWAAANDLYDGNSPVSNLKLKKQQQGREAYSDDEANRVMRYAANARNAYQQLIPRIGFYSGLRLNEIAQLYVDDVVTEEGVLCFRVTAARDDQKVKADSSRRLVLVHSELLEPLQGQIDRCKAEGSERLWPGLNHRRDGYGMAWYSIPCATTRSPDPASLKCQEHVDSGQLFRSQPDRYNLLIIGWIRPRVRSVDILS
jgi:integrase